MEGSFLITVGIPQADPSRVHRFTLDLRRLTDPIDPLAVLDTSGSQRAGYIIQISGALHTPGDLIRLRKSLITALKRTSPLYSIHYVVNLSLTGG